MADHFSKERIEEYKEAFDLIDTNKDGKITISEIAALMRDLGQSPSDEFLEKIVSEVGVDGTGSIDFQKFCQMMDIVLSEEDRHEQIDRAFRVFDHDGNGYISSAELGLAMTKLGKTMTAKQIQEMIREADIDADGQISYKEFKTVALELYGRK